MWNYGFRFQRNKYSGRSHWGKSGLVYHSSESLDIKLDSTARQKFIGKVYIDERRKIASMEDN